MIEYLKNLLVYYLSEDTLVRFRWYRRRVGGYWCYSHLLGWERRQPSGLALHLNVMFRHPILYEFGRDIEIYEPFDWKEHQRMVKPSLNEDIQTLIERIEIDEREGDHWTTDAVVYELKELLK